MSISSRSGGAEVQSTYDYGRRREDLMCRALGLEYNLVQRMGILWLSPENCTDMEGAINLFQAIDPDVALIFTFQVNKDLQEPGVADTAYVRHPREGTWAAIPGDVAAQRLSAAGILPLVPSKVITEMPACAPEDRGREGR